MLKPFTARGIAFVSQGMGQGNDRGTQYRSGIYCGTEQQHSLATQSMAGYQAALVVEGGGAGLGHRITTEIIYPAPRFFHAEEQHQQYLAKPGARLHCSAMPTSVSLPAFASWAAAAPESALPVLSEFFWLTHAPKIGCVLREPNEQIEWEDDDEDL